jgi:murein DD-endopeptidase MepM/ murein hydrolase activator NlpD
MLIFLPIVKLFAQIDIPKDYFGSPLHIGLMISGSYSEVRPNHFHSGIDLKVQQKEGMPVYAVADGVISRIKVSPVGFGNALYIDHPNGFTSVYGHLQGYNDTIASYLRTYQYKQSSFEVDLFPKNKKDLIAVKKGELIGYAGNSGSSGGAHLHFEIRNTKTEHTINPLLFGFDIADNLSLIHI